MNPTIHRRLVASLLTSIGLVAGLGACGGSDDSKREGPPPSGISEVEVNALKLNTPRSVVEKRFGKPVDPQGWVPAGTLTGQPKRLTCTYYKVKGGVQRDFIQLCFKRGGKLGSKLSLITPPRR